MARISSQKWQKEKKRKEKQELKAQKRAERKFAKSEISNQEEKASEGTELPPEQPDNGIERIQNNAV